MADEEQARAKLALAIESENRIKIAGIFLTLTLVVVMLLGGAIALSHVVPKLEDVHRLEQQRQCESRHSALAFAVILDDLAANFETPPAPAPDRLKAVQSLRDSAKTFRAAAAQHDPPACPSGG